MTKEDILHHFQDINFYYNDSMMYDDLSRMLDELIAENKGEWIPISERLPEVDQNVLATTRWGEVTIAERLNIGPDCWFICEGEANAHTEDIVAWQPLPEPYKAEKGGE